MKLGAEDRGAFNCSCSTSHTQSNQSQGMSPSALVGRDDVSTQALRELLQAICNRLPRQALNELDRSAQSNNNQALVRLSEGCRGWTLPELTNFQSPTSDGLSWDGSSVRSPSSTLTAVTTSKCNPVQSQEGGKDHNWQRRLLEVPSSSKGEDDSQWLLDLPGPPDGKPSRTTYCDDDSTKSLTSLSCPTRYKAGTLASKRLASSSPAPFLSRQLSPAGSHTSVKDPPTSNSPSMPTDPELLQELLETLKLVTAKSDSDPEPFIPIMELLFRLSSKQERVEILSSAKATLSSGGPPSVATHDMRNIPPPPLKGLEPRGPADASTGNNVSDEDILSDICNWLDPLPSPLAVGDNSQGLVSTISGTAMPAAHSSSSSHCRPVITEPIGLALKRAASDPPGNQVAHPGVRLELFGSEGQSSFPCPKASPELAFIASVASAMKSTQGAKPLRGSQDAVLPSTSIFNSAGNDMDELFLSALGSNQPASSLLWGSESLQDLVNSCASHELKVGSPHASCQFQTGTETGTDPFSSPCWYAQAIPEATPEAGPPGPRESLCNILPGMTSCTKQTGLCLAACSCPSCSHSLQVNSVATVRDLAFTPSDNSRGVHWAFADQSWDRTENSSHVDLCQISLQNPSRHFVPSNTINKQLQTQLEVSSAIGQAETSAWQRSFLKESKPTLRGQVDRKSQLSVGVSSELSPTFKIPLPTNSQPETLVKFRHPGSIQKDLADIPLLSSPKLLVTPISTSATKRKKSKDEVLPNMVQTAGARPPKATKRSTDDVTTRLQDLQRLIPGGNKADTASMLDEASEYIKFMELQVKILYKCSGSGTPGRHTDGLGGTALRERGLCLVKCGKAEAS